MGMIDHPLSATPWMDLLAPCIVLVLILSMGRVRHRLVSDDKAPQSLT
jgi:hypothetical protein